MAKCFQCKYWPNLFSLFLIVLLATNYFVPFADLDFTWQIRTGEQIVKTGQLQPLEPTRAGGIEAFYTANGKLCPASRRPRTWALRVVHE